MNFKFDPEKSKVNKEKYGISLVVAQHLLDVPAIEIPAKTVDEPRYMIIGKLGEKCYSCIYTLRGDKVPSFQRVAAEKWRSRYIMTTSNKDTLKAREFDAAFDKGDVNDLLDTQAIKARYPTQRISIDFPKTVIENVDKEAEKIGVTRTALIKMWVSQHLPTQPEHRSI